MRENYSIKIEQGSGFHRAHWHWFLDGLDGQLAQGIEDTPEEAAICATATLALLRGNEEPLAEARG